MCDEKYNRNLKKIESAEFCKYLLAEQIFISTVNVNFAPYILGVGIFVQIVIMHIQSINKDIYYY